jgi:predicted DNA-binding protein
MSRVTKGEKGDTLLQNLNKKTSVIKSELLIKEKDFYNAKMDLPNEKWVELGFADKLYELSNYGRLKSYALNEEGVILRNRNTQGYKRADILVYRKRVTYYIHKLVAEYYIENDDPENKKVVIHIDNNRQNNYFENLKWTTGKETFWHTEKFNDNLRKKFRLNKTSSAKIKRKDAYLIREMIENGIAQNKIAKIFNLSEMQITRIKRNENWVSKKSQTKNE